MKSWFFFLQLPQWTLQLSMDHFKIDLIFFAFWSHAKNLFPFCLCMLNSKLQIIQKKLSLPLSERSEHCRHLRIRTQFGEIRSEKHKTEDSCPFTTRSPSILWWLAFLWCARKTWVYEHSNRKLSPASGALFHSKSLQQRLFFTVSATPTSCLIKLLGTWR